jgi:hypothetical protein
MDKLVRIRDSTYNELAKRGKWDDTMDSIIQRLLHQQNNHGIGDTPNKSEREERPLQDSNVRKSARDMPQPFDNGDNCSIGICHRNSRANISYVIAEDRTRCEAETSDEKVVEQKRQRKKMMLPNGDNDKNALQGLQVGRQVSQAVVGTTEIGGSDTTG